MKPANDTPVVFTAAGIVSVEREDGSVVQFKVYRPQAGTGVSTSALAEVMILATPVDESLLPGERSRRPRRFGQ